MDIVVASHNDDKIRELTELINVDFVRLIPMREAGFVKEIAEDGLTYQENALIKARAVHAVCGGCVLADDSGLSVDALDGAPGIYSSRFAGVAANYDDKISAIWHLLEATPQNEWTASFHCALALILPDGSEQVFEGVCSGLIWPERRGENGFGYDPVFYVPAYHMTTAEMAPELKHSISHRGIAASKLRMFLREKHTAQLEME